MTFSSCSKELPRCLAISFVHQLRDRELAGSINAYEEMKLALHLLNFCDVNLEEADGVALEFSPLWLVPVDLQQARDPVSLKTAMQP